MYNLFKLNQFNMNVAGNKQAALGRHNQFNMNVAGSKQAALRNLYYIS